MKIMSNVEALHALNQGYIYNREFGFIKSLNQRKEERGGGFRTTSKQRSWLSIINGRVEDRIVTENKEQLKEELNLGKLHLIHSNDKLIEEEYLESYLKTLEGLVKERTDLKPTAIKLYLLLLKMYKENESRAENWLNCLTLKNNKLMELLGVKTQETLTKARKALLDEWLLFTEISGKRGINYVPLDPLDDLYEKQLDAINHYIRNREIIEVQRNDNKEEGVIDEEERVY